MMKFFYNYEPYYGDLKNEENFQALVNDMIKSIDYNITGWGMEFDYEKIKKGIPVKERSVVRLFKYFFDEYAKSKSKPRWMCKDNDLIDYVWKLKSYFKNSKFIYLVRDPRDVCLSYYNVPMGPNTAYIFAMNWKKHQEKCIRVYTDEEFRDGMILVKYEEILTNEEKTFKKICNFLGEDFEPEMIKGIKRKESSKTDYWKNISKDIMTKNYKKYLKGLSEREIKIIENILYKEMKFLGYDLEFKDSDYKFNPLEPMYYGIYDKFKKRYKKKSELKGDEAEVRRKRAKLKSNIQKKCRL